MRMKLTDALRMNKPIIGAFAGPFAIVLICAACALAGKATMTLDSPQFHPGQKPPPGLGQILEEMKADADEIICQIAVGSGSVDQRQRIGIFEVFAVMRPRFGPANAQLFNDREKKLLELARALGVTDPMVQDVDGHRLDRYFETVERAAEALRSRGFRVEMLPVSSSAIDWAPVVPGRVIRASDPTRTLPEFIPYAELRPEPTVPRNVLPRVTLYMFPAARMITTQRMVTREQPGELMGALESAYVFTLQAPQSGDTDDGKTLAAVMDTLFAGTKRKPVEVRNAAAALGAKTAELFRGVLRVTRDQPAPQSLPDSIAFRKVEIDLACGPARAAVIEAVLWSVGGGSEIGYTILPTR